MLKELDLNVNKVQSYYIDFDSILETKEDIEKKIDGIKASWDEQEKTLKLKLQGEEFLLQESRYAIIIKYSNGKGFVGIITKDEYEKYYSHYEWLTIYV